MTIAIHNSDSSSSSSNNYDSSNNDSNNHSNNDSKNKLVPLEWALQKLSESSEVVTDVVVVAFEVILPQKGISR